jgi:hypothetical protein
MIPPKRVLYLPIGISYEDIDFNRSGFGCRVLPPLRQLCDNLLCTDCALFAVQIPLPEDSFEVVLYSPNQE